MRSVNTKSLNGSAMSPGRFDNIKEPTVKPSMTLNIVAAAFSGGIVAAIMQVTNTPIPEKNSALNTTHSPVVHTTNTNDSQIQNRYNTVIDELNHVKAELEKLRANQDQIQQAQQNLSNTFVSFKNSHNAPSQASTHDYQTRQNEPIEQNSVENQLSRIDSLDNQMRTLDNDTAWETEALSTITNNFESIYLEGSALQTVECQGIMCRIEVAHNTETDVEIFFEDTFKIVPWDHKGKFEIIEDDNGRLSSLYYVTREGESFLAQ